MKTDLHARVPTNKRSSLSSTSDSTSDTFPGSSTEVRIHAIYLFIVILLIFSTVARNRRTITSNYENRKASEENDRSCHICWWFDKTGSRIYNFQSQKMILRSQRILRQIKSTLQRPRDSPPPSFQDYIKYFTMFYAASGDTDAAVNLFHLYFGQDLEGPNIQKTQNGSIMYRSPMICRIKSYWRSLSNDYTDSSQKAVVWSRNSKD